MERNSTFFSWFLKGENNVLCKAVKTQICVGIQRARKLEQAQFLVLLTSPTSGVRGGKRK